MENVFVLFTFDGNNGTIYDKRNLNEVDVRRMMQRVTIKDIAKKAGVANSTVTNALNPDSKKISQEKRQYILQIVEEMNYHPMRSAQNLKNKNKRVVGFFMRQSKNFNDGLINQKLIYYFNQYAHEKDLELVTIILSHDEEAGFKEIQKAINEYNLTHIIIQGIDIEEYIMNSIIKLNIPKVLIEIPIVNQTTKYICTDNFRAQRELTSTVLANHQINRVLYFSGSKSAYVTVERVRGFKDAIRKTGIAYDIVDGTFERDEVPELIKDIDFSQYDYIACGSDLIVAALAKHCQTIGLKDIVFSGFDGVDYLSYFEYQMYTVFQKIDLLSDKVINMIIEDALQVELIDYDIISNKEII